MGKSFSFLYQEVTNCLFQHPYRGYGAKVMALERKNAAAAATAAATSDYASPYSSMTSLQLQAEYQSVTGQSRCRFFHIRFPDILF